MFLLLAPLALAASAVLAVPVVVHLLKPKRVRTMPFSSLRWLRSSQHKLSRRIQWHQLLLFFLRALFLCALVLALAKPVFSPGRDRSSRERFVVVDVSRSMGYAVPGEETPLERAKKLAVSLLGGGLPGDRTTVLLAGHKTSTLGPLSGDPGAYRPRLEAARIQGADSSLGPALALVADQLQTPRAEAKAELFFLTDNHRGAWSQESITQFMMGCAVPISVHVLDVGPTTPGNAWIAEARPVETSGRKSLRVRMGASGVDPVERTLRLRKPAALNSAAQTVTLVPGAIAEIHLPLPSDLDASQIVAELALEPPDALPEDDVFHAPLSAPGPRILMLEPLTTQIESLQPGYHLRAALEVLGHTGAVSAVVTRRTPETVVASDFANADIVVLANVPQLGDDQLLSLENRVKNGAGLLVFLGPDTVPAFYDNGLYNPKAGNLSLLPVPPGVAVAGGLSSLTRIDWKHPLLAAFSDPAFGDLSRMRAKTHHRFEGIPTDGSTSVLACFDDGAPAMMERLVGAGRVLMFNTTANDAWSDLPRRGGFLPLIDRAIPRVLHARLGRSFRTGEPVTLPVPAVGANARVTLTSPLGHPLPVTLEGAGAQFIVRIDPPDETGVYGLRTTGDGGTADTQFFINAGLGESTTQKVDGEILRSWWNGAAFEITHPDPNTVSGRGNPEGHLPLWPPLLLTAALLFLAEMVLVHRLTPAMNPATVASTVARHGIVGNAPRREVGR
jgi:hypothetical protein